MISERRVEELIQTFLPIIMWRQNALILDEVMKVFSYMSLWTGEITISNNKGSSSAE